MSILETISERTRLYENAKREENERNRLNAEKAAVFDNIINQVQADKEKEKIVRSVEQQFAKVLQQKDEELRRTNSVNAMQQQDIGTLLMENNKLQERNSMIEYGNMTSALLNEGAVNGVITTDFVGALEDKNRALTREIDELLKKGY